MNMSYVFPQVVLAAIILVGGGAGDGGARAGASYEAGVPLCSVAVTVLWGQSQALSCWSRNSEVQVQTNSVPFKCVLLSLPAPARVPQRGAMLKQEGPVWALSM